MNYHKKMFALAMDQMSGFSLEGSSQGDNRTIFSLMESLIRSASGETLNDCRKSLSAVLQLKSTNPREKFMGCKLELLETAIKTLFGASKDLLSEKMFRGYNRSMLLEYLETCRRMFTSKYAINVVKNKIEKVEAEVEQESEFARKIRLALEGGSKKEKTKKKMKTSNN